MTGGDRIDIFGRSYYFESAADPFEYKVPAASVLEGLFGAPASPACGKTTTGSVLGVPAMVGAVGDFLSAPGRNSEGTSSTPRAYINWILLDENFRFVAEGSSFDPVGSAGAVKPHSITGIAIKKAAIFMCTLPTKAIPPCSLMSS